MGFEELLEYLDLEDADEFQYFENLADIIECEKEISEDALEKLFAEVDSDTLTEIVGNYFSELTEKVPQKSVDIYTLIDTIGRALGGLAKSLSDDDGANVSLFAEELSKFRKWYMFETEVNCRNLSAGTETVVPVSEAISLYRLEALDGDEYDYDFENCLDYPIEEYVMSFASLASAADDYDDFDSAGNNVHEFDDYSLDSGHDHPDHEGHTHIHKHYDESILDEGYVYDDEFSDEY